MAALQSLKFDAELDQLPLNLLQFGLKQVPTLGLFDHCMCQKLFLLIDLSKFYLVLPKKLLQFLLLYGRLLQVSPLSIYFLLVAYKFRFVLSLPLLDFCFEFLQSFLELQVFGLCRL